MLIHLRMLFNAHRAVDFVKAERPYGNHATGGISGYLENLGMRAFNKPSAVLGGAILVQLRSTQCVLHLRRIGAIMAFMPVVVCSTICLAPVRRSIPSCSGLPVAMASARLQCRRLLQASGLQARQAVLVALVLRVVRLGRRCLRSSLGCGSLPAPQPGTGMAPVPPAAPPGVAPQAFSGLASCCRSVAGASAPVASSAADASASEPATSSTSCAASWSASSFSAGSAAAVACSNTRSAPGATVSKYNGNTIVRMPSTQLPATPTATIKRSPRRRPAARSCRGLSLRSH